MTISYTHQTHPRARSIKLKIESGGQLIVVTPRGVPKFLIDQFVNRQQAWITKHLTRQRRQQANSIKPNEVLIFGKKYEIKPLHETDRPLGVKLVNKFLMINFLTADPSQAKLNSSLEMFLKGTAEKYIFPRAYQLSKLMKIEFQRLTLRQQKSRWGSCSSRGTLSFNWRLVHFEPEIIDYVIIHELAHRVHMNHSAAFWQLVKTYDQKHLIHRRVLRQHHIHFT